MAHSRTVRKIQVSERKPVRIIRENASILKIQKHMVI